MTKIRHIAIPILISFLHVNWSLCAINPIMSSSTSEIHNFLNNGQGSANAKLVFSNLSYKENTVQLCYINFALEIDTPVVYTLDSAQDAKVPVISPDGKWVVFARGNGVEAGSPVAKRSSIYLCKLEQDAIPIPLVSDSACEPRFLQQADQLTVIYATLAPNFAWEGIGKTMKITIDTTVEPPAIGTPEVLFEHGGYTGGLSWDGKYLCTGGGNVVMIDLTSGATKPDTVSPFAQSCNASISSSHYYTNTMIYLTTIASHPLVNGGKPWGKWQVILINNSDGELMNGYSYPTTYTFPIETNPESFSKARWHHSEWSNHPYFAAATLNADRYFEIGGEYVNTRYQERLYLLNLKDSSYIEVLHPEAISYNDIPDDESGFHWPWLWVEITDNFKEDSTWLTSSTEITTNPSGKINTHISIKNDHLYSDKAISSISLYQLTGKCIQSISLPHKPKSINLATFNLVGAGIYFLRVTCPSKSIHTFRFIKTR